MCVMQDLSLTTPDELMCADWSRAIFITLNYCGLAHYCTIYLYI